MTLMLNSYFKPDEAACAKLAEFYAQLRACPCNHLVDRWIRYSDVAAWFPANLQDVFRIGFSAANSQLFEGEHPHYADYMWQHGIKIEFYTNKTRKTISAVVILLPWLTDTTSPPPVLLVEKGRPTRRALPIATAFVTFLNRLMARQVEQHIAK